MAKNNLSIALNRNFVFNPDFLICGSWDEVMEQINGNVWARVKISVNCWGIVVNLEAV